MNFPHVDVLTWKIHVKFIRKYLHMGTLWIYYHHALFVFFHILEEVGAKFKMFLKGLLTLSPKCRGNLKKSRMSPLPVHTIINICDFLFLFFDFKHMDA